MKLHKIFMISAAALMMASVGASANTPNVNARHVRTHRSVRKHSAKALHNYYHKKYVHKYDVYKLHHSKRAVSKAQAYREGEHLSYEACLNGEIADGGNYTEEPSILKKLGINKHNRSSYENGVSHEVNYVERKGGSSIFGKNIHVPLKQRVFWNHWLQGIVIGFHNNKATGNTIGYYLKDYKIAGTNKDPKFDKWFDKNYKVVDKTNLNYKHSPIKLRTLIINKHNKKATAELLSSIPK